VTLWQFCRHETPIRKPARAAAVDALVSSDSHLLVLRGVVPALTPAESLTMITKPVSRANGRARIRSLAAHR
jgi:hypothetical protein